MVKFSITIERYNVISPEHREKQIIFHQNLLYIETEPMCNTQHLRLKYVTSEKY